MLCEIYFTNISSSIVAWINYMSSIVCMYIRSSRTDRCSWTGQVNTAFNSPLRKCTRKALLLEKWRKNLKQVIITVPIVCQQIRKRSSWTHILIHNVLLLKSPTNFCLLQETLIRIKTPNILLTHTILFYSRLFLYLVYQSLFVNPENNRANQR